MPTTANIFDVDTVLVELQNAARDRLTSDTWYAGIDVYTPDDMTEDGKAQAVADFQQRIAQSLSPARKGICILISAPILQQIATDAPDLVASNVPFLVRIIEMPLINRGASGTRKTASVVGIHTLRRLRGFVFLGSAFVCVSAGLVPSDIKAGTLVWDIVYKTSLDLASVQPTEE